MNLLVRKALRLVFDQKTNARASSEETSLENDVKVEIEKGNFGR